jgi:hypothetical protein
MMDVYPDIPGSVRYPIEEILDMLPVFRGDEKNKFLSSSFDYSMAMAIREQPDKIMIIGYDMGTETEYRYQREGLSFWSGVCAGRGIELWIPEEASFLNSKLYGYEKAHYVAASELHEMLAGLEIELAEADQLRHDHREAALEDEQFVTAYYRSEWRYHRIHGAVSTVKQLIDTHMVGLTDEILNRQKLEALNSDMLFQRNDWLAKMNFWSGVVADRQENEWGTPEIITKAEEQYNTVRARFYALDGSVKVLSRLVCMIDGQPYEVTQALLEGDDRKVTEIVG